MERSSILEIFSLPQAKEISRESLLLRTDILRKQSLGAPAQSISFRKFVKGVSLRKESGKSTDSYF